MIYVEKVLKLSHTHELKLRVRANHNSPLVVRVATSYNALRVLHDISTIKVLGTHGYW